jgi:CHAT domain-containing protein
MAEYSDDSSCSSDSSDDEIECVLKKIPKASVPEPKQKRVYNKKPMTEEQKAVLVDKLAKARAAKAAKNRVKQQGVAQEKAELAELKKLKDKGQLKIKKERPAPVETKKKKEKQVVIKEIHHYHEAEAKPVKEKRTATPANRPPPPPQQKMMFA